MNLGSGGSGPETAALIDEEQSEPGGSTPVRRRCGHDVRTAALEPRRGRRRSERPCTRRLERCSSFVDAAVSPCQLVCARLRRRSRVRRRGSPWRSGRSMPGTLSATQGEITLRSSPRLLAIAARRRHHVRPAQAGATAVCHWQPLRAGEHHRRPKLDRAHRPGHHRRPRPGAEQQHPRRSAPRRSAPGGGLPGDAEQLRLQRQPGVQNAEQMLSAATRAAARTRSRC